MNSKTGLNKQSFVNKPKAKKGHKKAESQVNSYGNRNSHEQRKSNGKVIEHSWQNPYYQSGQTQRHTQVAMRNESNQSLTVQEKQRLTQGAYQEIQSHNGSMKHIF